MCCLVLFLLCAASRVNMNKVLQKMKTVCAKTMNSIEGLLHINRAVPIHAGGICIPVFRVMQS